MAAILFGGEKGGTGKTSLAVNIATYLAVEGDDVCLLDADPQRSAAEWADRRNERQPERARVHCVQRTGDVSATIRDLAGKYAHVIVDAGGRDSRELRSALLAVQALYSPIRASQFDLETLAKLADLIATTRLYNPALACHSVLSLAPTNPHVREAEEARESLGAYAAVLPLTLTVIRERKVFRDGAVAGLGVVEMANAQARAEIIQLAAEMFDVPTDGQEEVAA